MAAVELLLVRHGESEANAAGADAERRGAERIGITVRDADVALSPLGRRQAEALGGHLGRLPAAQGPQAVWVSPYRRARETADIALRTAGLDLPVRVDERLRDRDLGVLEGYTTHGADRAFPEETARRRLLGKFYYRPPAGESWTDLALRIRSLLPDIDAGGAERVLVVSHDAVSSVIRYVTERIEERELLDEVRRNPMPNASLTRLVRHGQVWKAEAVNAVGHLGAHGGAATTSHSGEPDTGP